MKQTSSKTGIGATVNRQYDDQKAVGTLQYTDDLFFGNHLLHARPVRSPYACAQILSIDASEAMKMEGVRFVVIGTDFPHRFGLYLKDRYPIAVDQARYIGEPVALVVAESEEIAEQALGKVNVKYKPMPSVLDPVQAATDSSILVHPELGQYEKVSFLNPQPGTNLGNWFKIRRGNVEQAFAEADFIVEEEVRCPQIAHGFLETHCCISQQDLGTGEITVWTAAQSAFAVREILADGMKMPQNKIRVIAPPIGGGFGGKAGMTIEALCLSASTHPKARGRPVKLFVPREEVMLSSWVRQAYVARIKIGVKKDGKITGIHNTFYFDTGISAEYGANPVRSAGYTSTGTYYIPNVHTDCYAVYTHKPFGGAYRGFGLPELMSAMEVVVDIAARKLNMDPLTFRTINMLKEGLPTCTGMPMAPHGLEQISEQVKERIGFGEQTEPTTSGRKRGKGIAFAIKAPAMPADASSSAIVKVNGDGTVEVLAATMDMGQGAYTAYAQIVSEELGIPYGQIRCSFPDTQSHPYDWQTVASRSCWSMGMAVKRAAIDAREQILQLYAECWQAEPQDLRIEDGMVFCKRLERKEPLDQKMTNGFLMPDGVLKGGPIIGKGRFIPPDVVYPDAETGQSPKSVVHFTLGAVGVDLEVVEGTGEVIIHKIAAGYDVGKAISPINVRGQIEGGTVQGVSAALMEGIYYNADGKLLNPDFTDYKIATTKDANFEMDVFWEETPEALSPYGNRGVGEHSMISPAPAINNALFNALGIRIHQYPLSRERVYGAIQAAKRGETDYYD